MSVKWVGVGLCPGNPKVQLLGWHLEMLLCSISCCSLWGRFRDSELPKTASAWIKSHMHGPMAFATLASRRFRTMCILFALACVCTCELGQICRFAAIGLNLAFQTPLVHPILWETSNTWSCWLPRMVFWSCPGWPEASLLGFAGRGDTGSPLVFAWAYPMPNPNLLVLRCETYRSAEVAAPVRQGSCFWSSFNSSFLSRSHLLLLGCWTGITSGSQDMRSVGAWLSCFDSLDLCFDGCYVVPTDSCCSTKLSQVFFGDPESKVRLHCLQ